MLKKTAEGKTRTSLEVKCRECQHFETGPAYYEKPCKDMGIKPGASPCDGFFPDVMQTREIGKDTLTQLKSIVESMNASQSRIIAVFMARSEWFKKADLGFMQEVVFCFGQNYLCNYARGYVVGTTKDGSEVFLSSTLEKLNKGKNAHVRLLRESVKTLEQFKKIKSDLIKQDRVMEPARTGTKISTFQMLTMSKKEHAAHLKLLQQNPNDYQPPTLDTVPDSWRDNRTPSKVMDPMLRKKEVKKVKRGEKSATTGSKSVKIKR